MGEERVIERTPMPKLHQKLVVEQDYEDNCCDERIV